MHFKLTQRRRLRQTRLRLRAELQLETRNCRPVATSCNLCRLVPCCMLHVCCSCAACGPHQFVHLLRQKQKSIINRSSEFQIKKAMQKEDTTKYGYTFPLGNWNTMNTLKWENICIKKLNKYFLMKLVMKFLIKLKMKLVMELVMKTAMKPNIKFVMNLKIKLKRN